ncbi:hypothetical protein RZS08_04290, partial [Arthrospira platensis SPKY1]|nr:hypothetical protein [Arthrospira platensis SPKY1]
WRTLIASHPVYDYFARRYALELENLHWEPETMPVESEWRRLEALLLEHPGAAMIWEDTPEPEIAARLDRLGLPHTVVHTGDQQPEAGDLLTLLQGNLDRLTR